MARLTRAAAVLAVTAATAAAPFPAASAPPAKTGQIRIAYVAPKNPAHQPLLDAIRNAQVLERLQEFLSPVRLPHPLLLKTEGCDGVSNAWYEDGAVTICYEVLQEILDNARSAKRPANLSERAAITGPFVDMVLHETAHALFELLEIPVMGREEDAADAVSAYVMLQFGRDDARDLLGGAAYSYALELKLDDPTRLRDVEIRQKLESFADEHGTPAQRLYTLLCVAYGADPKYFANLVEQGWLPKSRAEGCEFEYWQVSFAYKRLIAPHVDQALAKKVRSQTWLRPPGKRPPSPATPPKA